MTVCVFTILIRTDEASICVFHIDGKTALDVPAGVGELEGMSEDQLQKRDGVDGRASGGVFVPGSKDFSDMVAENAARAAKKR